MTLPRLDPPIKVGETYSQGGALTTAAGVAIDLTGYTATSQLRDGEGTEIGEFTVTIDAGAGGTFVIEADAAETASWEPGLYRCDVRFVSPTDTVHPSPTFLVPVSSEITEAAP